MSNNTALLRQCAAPLLRKEHIEKRKKQFEELKHRKTTSTARQTSRLSGETKEEWKKRMLAKLHGLRRQ